MNTVSCCKRRVAVCLAALIASACASVVPAPRFSAPSPAEASGPESPVAPARPILTEGGELADLPEGEAVPGNPHHHHAEPAEPNP